MAGNIDDIKSPYTRHDTPCTTCSRLRFISTSLLSLSPNAVEGDINDIISQYTRGDTPCTTCSRQRLISNLTPCSLQTLWRAILMISYRHTHEVIRPVQPAAGYDSSRASLISLSRRYGGQSYWHHIAIYTWWYALYNLQPATIHLKPHFLFSPDAREGNIKSIISQYTRGDTLYNLQPVTIHLEPHPFLSSDAMEGNIKYIISQYTRGDTPCTTCSRLRFVSNLTHSLLVPSWCQPW